MSRHKFRIRYIEISSQSNSMALCWMMLKNHRYYSGALMRSLLVSLVAMAFWGLTACPQNETETVAEVSPTPLPVPTEAILVNVSPTPFASDEKPSIVPTATPAPDAKAEALKTPENTQPLSPKMFVSGNPTLIYKEGKSASGIVAELPVSTEVYLLHFNESDQFPGWVLVEFQYNDFPESGWVQRKFLKTRPIVSLTGEDQAAMPARLNSGQKSLTQYINTEQVNLRQSPSLNAAIVQVATLNTPVTLGQQQAQAEGYLWKEIQLSDGRKAWVADKFLSPKIRKVVAPVVEPPAL